MAVGGPFKQRDFHRNPLPVCIVGGRRKLNSQRRQNLVKPANFLNHLPSELSPLYKIAAIQSDMQGRIVAASVEGNQHPALELPKVLDVHIFFAWVRKPVAVSLQFFAGPCAALVLVAFVASVVEVWIVESQLGES